MLKDLKKTLNDLTEMIDTVNWHQTMPEPNLTIKMIEAKAKLMEARKKLVDVIKVVENSCEQE